MNEKIEELNKKIIDLEERIQIFEALIKPLRKKMPEKTKDIEGNFYFKIMIAKKKIE